MIVIDIGAAQYGGDRSIQHLIDEFDPDVLYGFDPNPAVLDSMPEFTVAGAKDGRLIKLECKAAWIYDGEIAFTEAGLGSSVGKGKQKVPCFDLARFIKELAMPFYRETFFPTEGEVTYGPPMQIAETGGVEGTWIETDEGMKALKPYEPKIVLKMDAEMAEYTILPHLIEQDADLLLSLAWIEWHPHWEGIPEKRQPIEDALRCEVREWRY